MHDNTFMSLVLRPFYINFRGYNDCPTTKSVRGIVIYHYMWTVLRLYHDQNKLYVDEHFYTRILYHGSVPTSLCSNTYKLCAWRRSSTYQMGSVSFDPLGNRTYDLPYSKLSTLFKHCITDVIQMSMRNTQNCIYIC